jgi:divalent metal cation (Fe/Co/Zn/Cd) transporter
VKEKWMIGIMVTGTVVKIGLMTYCCRFKNEIDRAYAQDHFFDVITNSIGLATTVLAIKFYWWLDPLGAILVCPSVHRAHSTFSPQKNMAHLSLVTLFLPISQVIRQRQN